VHHKHLLFVGSCHQPKVRYKTAKESTDTQGILAHNQGQPKLSFPTVRNETMISLPNTFSLVISAIAISLTVDHCKADETIRVLCYNIHYGQGMDGIYDVKRLAKVINQSRPDFVALQEVDVGVKRSGRVHQAQRLAELTGMSVRFGPTQHYEGGLFGNAVLTRHAILDVLINPLPYTESTPERTTYPRGAIAVTVRTSDDQRLRFVSTHFQHNVSEDRVAEAKAINQLFANGKDSIPTILAGDMNAKPKEEPIKILLSKWTCVIEEPPIPSSPATAPRSRIDYIFFRTAERFRLLSTKVIDESLASDHRPVFAELEILNR
jgi:endonuclease/exonuclease/phosphatase family metal-dependent hydrolase